jgi:predicted heme/steroid binding protein
MRYSPLTGLLSLLLILLCIPSLLYATPEYSGRTGQSCKTCHTSKEGGALSESGLEYAASGYVWPPTGGYRVLGPIRKSVRFIIGLLHILAAFMWFGTILYVHILLRPGYAAKGLPRGEVSLGVVSMGVVGITGVLLAISRIKGIDVLIYSPWGLLLSLKILLYIVMVCSAMFVVIFIGPKLKKGSKSTVIPKDRVFDPLILSGFNGKEGRPAYIVYKDTVYDVTGLKLWRNGIHMKHNAGSDLTDFLSKAPHGDEKLESVKVAGSFDTGRKPQKNIYQKMFYAIAYMNLAIVFLVLIVIAFWRWGI